MTDVMSGQYDYEKYKKHASWIGWAIYCDAYEILQVNRDFKNQILQFLILLLQVFVCFKNHTRLILGYIQIAMTIQYTIEYLKSKY